MHSCDRAVLLDAGFEFNEEGMPATMEVKTLFTRKEILDRPIENERSFSHADYVIDGIALPAETAAVGRGDHANMRSRHFQNFRQCTVKVMRSLRAGPNGQLSILVVDGDRSMLLDGKMGIPLKEKSVLKDLIGFGKAFFHVAKLQCHQLVNVSLFAVLVDARFWSRQSFFGIGDGRQDFIVDVDQVERFEGRQLLARDDRSDGISNVPHVVDAKSLFVLADGKNSVLDRNIFPRQD